MATIIPKNTPVPIPCRLAEPGPLAKTSGNIPRMKASDVITMGRNRKCAAFTTALTTVFPFSTSSLANSTIRIAFLATNQISITNPIWK